ncbi:unnamed protein product [Acanthosepion pharaonis]|uniref:Uncharacterized protein n=1 Tax=Acanthosepion pharaonis TaxID=158019 RepID=A0A812BIZ7_ACAPH|nr:unnamed protein product [Sepia pharaonis]
MSFLPSFSASSSASHFSFPIFFFFLLVSLSILLSHFPPQIISLSLSLINVFFIIFFLPTSWLFIYFHFSPFSIFYSQPVFYVCLSFSFFRRFLPSLSFKILSLSIDLLFFYIYPHPLSFSPHPIITCPTPDSFSSIYPTLSFISATPLLSATPALSILFSHMSGIGQRTEDGRD